MMENEIVIAAYGNARETTAVAKKSTGELIGTGKGEAVNIHLSVKQSLDVINQVATKALGENLSLDNPGYKFNLVIAIKYTELVESCIQLTKMAVLYNSVTIKSDGQALCLGAHNSDGCVIVADEGLVGNSSVKNQSIQIGGWGFPHADSGSLPWIGLEAIRMTLQWIDGCLEETPLLKAIYNKFECKTDRLITWALESRVSTKGYMEICHLVLYYCEKNDPASIKLLKNSAKEVEIVYNKLLMKNGVNSLPCALVGELSQHIQPFLSEKMKTEIVVREFTGVDGVLKIAKKENLLYS